MKTNSQQPTANSDTKSFILYIDTSEPEAVLVLYSSSLRGARGDLPRGKAGVAISEVAHTKWLAHRELSATLSDKIADLLNRNDLKMSDLGGVVVFEGPGSFTGLRIGIAHANALAYALGVPIYGTEEREKIDLTNPLEIVIPKYGALPNITKPKAKS